MLETKADMSLVSLFASVYEGFPMTHCLLKSSGLLLFAVVDRLFLSAPCFPSSTNLNLCVPSPAQGMRNRWHREHGGFVLTEWH